MAIRNTTYFEEEQNINNNEEYLNDNEEISNNSEEEEISYIIMTDENSNNSAMKIMSIYFTDELYSMPHNLTSLYIDLRYLYYTIIIIFMYLAKIYSYNKINDITPINALSNFT